MGPTSAKSYEGGCVDVLDKDTTDILANQK